MLVFWIASMVNRILAAGRLFADFKQGKAKIKSDMVLMDGNLVFYQLYINPYLTKAMTIIDIEYTMPFDADTIGNQYRLLSWLGQ